MAITLAAFLLRSVFYYIITYLGHRFGILVEADIREDLYRHFQLLDFDFYDKNRTGKLMNRLTGDLFEITELAHHGPEDLLISIATNHRRAYRHVYRRMEVSADGAYNGACLCCNCDDLPKKHGWILPAKLSREWQISTLTLNLPFPE